MLTWEYRRNFLSPTLIWHMQGATATNKNILHLSVFRIESILKLTRWFKYRLLACHFLHGCFTHAKLCIESQGSSNRKNELRLFWALYFAFYVSSSFWVSLWLGPFFRTGIREYIGGWALRESDAVIKRSQKAKLLKCIR